MAIELPHFDTKLKQSTQVQPEVVNNSLAEYLFPSVSFAIGDVYRGATTAEDLGEYEGKTLQFASGERMYFADTLVRDLVYPIPGDGAAYGSLVFTPCKSFSEQSVRVLIIDDTTGENGGILPNDVAQKLVGDCYGKINRSLATEVTGMPDTPFQFRLGTKPQAEDDYYRIAKGTLAPANLDNPVGELQAVAGYDLILATSSFKGRKDESAIQPGEYNLTIGLGIKTLAEYGEHSLGTQVLVNYPRGVEADILPQLARQAENLAQIQSDPRQLAAYYVDKYERRQALMAQENEAETGDDPDELLGTLDEVTQTAADEQSPPTKEDGLLYRLLKADLSGHLQILEHPKVTADLASFVRREWTDIATGRAIKFQAGLAQPSLDLGKDEICVPYFPEAEELIVTRSPLINSNGVIILTNKHLPKAMGQQGTVHIHPETAAAHLQADFDGDHLVFEKASKYPTLAAEIKEYNLQENRYPDVVKRDKIKYQGSFEEIAVSAMENKIGIIANQVQKSVALQWETQLLPDEHKAEYLQAISRHYTKLLQDDANPKKNFSLPDSFIEKIQPLASLPKNLTSQQIDDSLKQVKQVLFDTVSELSNELQVAADGPKSAARPNEEILSYCKALSNYRDVGWLQDKKNQKVYLNRPMASSNHSPIDLMVQQTNSLYEQNQLQARPAHEFRDLYLKDSFNPSQTEAAKDIRDTYNSLIKKAIELEERSKKSPSPSLTITSATTGRQLEITDLLKFNHPDVWKANHLSITLEADEHNPKYLNAVANNAIVGRVSSSSMQEHNLRPSIHLNEGIVSLQAGASLSLVKAAFQEANDYLESVRQNTHEAEKPALAAALWHVCHTKEDKSYGPLKKASVALLAFPDQLVDQLKELQFTQLTVVGTHFASNKHQGRQWAGETVPITVTTETDPNHANFGKRIITAAGEKLAPFSSESPQLPVGTTALAAITSPPGATVTATTSKGNTLKITQVRKHDYPDTQWNEDTLITIGFKDNPNPDKPPTPVALVDGFVLGVIDSDSFQTLKQRLHSAGRPLQGFTFAAFVQSTPATTAHLVVDPETVCYPESFAKLTPTIQESKMTQEQNSLPPSAPDSNSQSAPKREDWEQKMLNAAIRGIQQNPANTDAEIQTATIGDGKYLAIYHNPSNTLQVVDPSERGILYKAQKGQAAQIKNFTLAQQQEFLSSSRTLSPPESQQINQMEQ